MAEAKQYILSKVDVDCTENGKLADYNRRMPVLYNAADIQTIFKCGKKKSYEIMHMAGFPSFKIDNMIFVERGELLKWLARAKGKNFST